MRTEPMAMEQLAQLLTVQLENGPAPLRITGSSMHPMLRDRRDTVYLQAAGETLNKGDVILYLRTDGSYILHRIVRVRSNDSFLCAGDNQYKTEQVEKEQVLAVVDSFHRGKKHYTVDHTGYRFYVWLWVGLLPIRRPLLAVRRLLGRLRRRVRKSKI